MPGTHQPINAYEQIKEFYEGTKAAIEAETGVPEGSWGHATDAGGDIGYYLGGWIWQSDITGIPLSYLDTDGTLAANSDVKVATQKATKTYIDNSVTGLLDFKGATDCSGNPNYPAALKGDAYVVSVAGKIGGASGKSVDLGDVFIATSDNAGGTEAAVGTSWIVLEHNLQGALLAANNLSDVASASTSRTNLGLGALAVLNSLGINDLDDVNLADLADAVLLYYVLDDLEWQCLPLSFLASASHTHTDIPSTGWISMVQTWTYVSADDPVYQIYVSGDVTANADYKLGNKVKCTNNSTTFYGFIVKVGAYDSGNNRTPVDLYGGTDYDLANSAITAPFISKVKSPDGFPLSPAKWTVTTTDTADRSQATPTQNTWYNLGSLSISIPIGVWEVSYKVLARGAKSAATLMNMASTLSTANNSESDIDMTTFLTLGGASGTLVLLASQHCLPKIFALTAKTSYFLNGRSTIATMDSIGHRGDVGTTVIRALCAYL